jgi:hypothetical protein
MAKGTTSARTFLKKKRRKLGKHSKKKHSNSKTSKNYKKSYRGQGR